MNLQVNDKVTHVTNETQQMVIIEIVDALNIKCAWFTGDKRHEETFPPSELVKI